MGSLHELQIFLLRTGTSGRVSRLVGKSNTKIWIGTISFALLILVISPRMALAQWTTGTNAPINNTNNDNVGIGTTSPGAPLEAYKSAGINVTGGGVLVSRYNDGNGTFRGGAIYSRYISAVGDDALVFGVTSTGTKNPCADFDQARMTIFANGNVGIGTTEPKGTLEVHSTSSAGIPASASTTDGFVITNANRVVGLRIGWDDTNSGFYQQVFRANNAWYGRARA